MASPESIAGDGIDVADTFRQRIIPGDHHAIDGLLVA
jgi:hypothetical protein